MRDDGQFLNEVEYVQEVWPADGCKAPVPGQGSMIRRVLVGEAPGRNEDEQGGRSAETPKYLNAVGVCWVVPR